MPSAAAADTLAGAPFQELLDRLSQSKAAPSCDSENRGSCSGSAHGSRPNSARRSRPGSARGSRADTETGSQPPSARRSGSRGPFLRHVAQGKDFSPRPGYLEAKPARSQWDEERLFLPERAYPSAAVKGAAADCHDEHPERVNRPAWKPTVANRRSGLGQQIGPSFPMPPRPRSAARGGC
eukprot:TRINITY_DN64923_c0_g1_i1.p1 TRINITY_DN64923_c0_g1~~TRINITY_DN64923_c0_g1_i1.p1  ORF type:complete len:181 (+),score=23.07 TRINITY_DN64923_c0_g1_i1:43-585(+)